MHHVNIACLLIWPIHINSRYPVCSTVPSGQNEKEFELFFLVKHYYSCINSSTMAKTEQYTCIRQPPSKQEPWQVPAATNMGWGTTGHTGFPFTLIFPTFNSPTSQWAISDYEGTR